MSLSPTPLIPEFQSDSNTPERYPPTIRQIVAYVGQHYGLSHAEMTGSLKRKKLNHARRVAIFLAAKITCKSSTLIGNVMKRDHTTILNSLWKAEAELARADNELAQEIECLRQKILAIETLPILEVVQ